MARRKGTFTKAQMEILGKYESDMRTAYFGQYCMPVPEREFHEVLDIMKEATGVDYPNQAFCSGCVLRLMTDAGKYYFKQKEESEKAKKEES